MKMVRLHRFLVLGLFGAAVVVSCVKNSLLPDGASYTGDRQVSIQPTLIDGDWLPVKATDYDPLDNSLLQAKGFGVYAYYTGNEDYSATKESSEYTRFGLVYNNRKFYYDEGAWKYEGKDEFWPSTPGEKLSFFAYAPYDTWHEKVTYDGKVPTIQYDNFVAQSLSVSELEKQRDILWGTNTSGLAHKNVYADQYATPGTVDMHFRHAIAKVRFLVQGSLPGETVSVISTGTPTNISTGSSTQSDGDDFERIETSYNWVRRSNNSWSSYYYQWRCTVTETKRQGKSQIQTKNVTQRREPVYNTEGKRYYIESVSFKGFNKTGTLVLDNAAAYEPAWKDVTRFSGADPEYVLSSGNVLTDALQYVSAGTISSNFSKYTGVTETPSDMMGGYFLYAVPRFISGDDNIKVKLKYHIANVDATVNRVETRTVQQTRSREHSRTCKHTKQSDYITIYGEPTFSDFESNLSGKSFGSWSSWSGYSDGTWSEWETPDTEWTLQSESLSGATINYDNDPAPTLSGKILTPLQGGRAYDIKLILAGDKIELDVVPRPWDLEETSFDYTSNINDVIQALTYDSSYIDYADAAGNVYINNRMGKFYFRLGTGKYIAWQAALVGDAAFGFTDENGNFLLDANGERVSSIRGGVDPEVTNYIYVKALNSSSTVTSRAKLRIYYIDSNSDVTAAMNLVNVTGVNEWTIVQNAN